MAGGAWGWSMDSFAWHPHHSQLWFHPCSGLCLCGGLRRLVGSTRNAKNISPGISVAATSVALTIRVYINKTTGGLNIRLLFYLSLLLRSFSILRKNLYNGGPNNTAINKLMIRNSFQLIAMTGLHAIVTTTSIHSPYRPFLCMDYFSIGILMPCRFAASMAVSYPASACRTTPMPGSVVRTRSNLRAASGVPSATMT